MKEKADKYPLATKGGVMTLLSMLIYEGAMCPKCGYGTKKTSKRWARCKKCGLRVEVKSINNPSNVINQ